MKYHKFPGSDLEVSRLCFGCWGVISDAHWGQRDEDESISAMQAAVDAGVNFFDTAPMYGDGASERLLGRFVRQNGLREQVIIASKIRPNKMRPEDIESECDATLERLQTDYLDLYQTHWTDPNTPLIETWQAMLRLRDLGKVRHIGVCNAGTGDLGDILCLAKPLTNQLPYNLLWRMIEAEIMPLCIQEQIGVLAYSPLMHGILADKYLSADEVPEGRARSRHFSGNRPLARHGEAGCEELTFETLQRIREIASQDQRSMAELALSWVGQQTGVVSVIAGARNAAQVAQNIKYLDAPLADTTRAALKDATESLKLALGDNPDMWDAGSQARFH
ncbi:MAG: aldo/keto reductase [bacterium]|nr:aldo/keto reductase [bacterium]